MEPAGPARNGPENPKQGRVRPKPSSGLGPPAVQEGVGPGGARGSPSSSPPGSELERGRQSATCSPACEEPGRSAGERRAKLHQDLRPLPRAGIPASGPQASDAQRSTGPLGPRGWGPRANHLPLRPRRHLCRRLPPLGLLFKCSRSCSLFSRRPQALTADGAAASAKPGAGRCVRFCRVLPKFCLLALPGNQDQSSQPARPLHPTIPGCRGRLSWRP